MKNVSKSKIRKIILKRIIFYKRQIETKVDYRIRISDLIFVSIWKKIAKKNKFYQIFMYMYMYINNLLKRILRIFF